MIRQASKSSVKGPRRPSETLKVEKRKKAQLIEWPFIIYQLRDAEIQEDLAAMRRVCVHGCDLLDGIKRPYIPSHPFSPYLQTGEQ